MLEDLRQFFSNPWEIFGAITALWCVWLAARENILNWPVSLVSVALYAKVFYDSRFFSDAFLQIVFAGFQVYGWYQWALVRRNSNAGKFQTPKKVRLLSAKNRLFAGLIILLVWPLWYLFIIEVKPNANLPLMDSLAMVISITAIFLQAKKILESWWLWIVADMIYVPMYMAQDLQLTALIYFIFLGMAVYGLRRWTASLDSAKL